MSIHRPQLVGIAAALALVVALSIGAASAQEPAAPVLTPLPAISPRTDRPLAVITTTALLADLVRQIGGERVAVDSILPANADPHDFEPTPKQIVSVEQADLVVQHGLDLDRWAAELVTNSGTNAPVVTAADGVQTIASSEDGFTAGDPHVWFDPRNVKIMTGNIAVALSQLDPDGAAGYTARQTAYSAQLDALDSWIATQIATVPPDRRKLVTSHDSLAYFVARYGLTYTGAVIPSLDTRAEPSAKETAKLIETIKSEGVPAIFTEAAIDPRLERQLAEQAGVAIVPDLYADTLGEPGSSAGTYIGMMVYDTNLIVTALR